jgi:hypothetical protein
MNNLDAKINMVGFKIAEILDENMINKLLGVLANDGVYAMWVYAKAKKDIDENELLGKLKDILEINSQRYEIYFQKLSENINELLFRKELIEKALIYARYHAKAMGD